MLVILFRFLSIFPLSVLHLIGAVLGRIVYLLSGSYRRRLRENLERAGFSAHLSDAVKEAGKNILELPFIWCAKPDRVLRTASLENWDLVQQALDAKKGVIFLTPHLGCFEIVAQSIAVRTRLTVMYRPPRKDALKPLIEGAVRAKSVAGTGEFIWCAHHGEGTEKRRGDWFIARSGAAGR
jgi:KDO2-lipid IV(A) lauroyltransferase